MWVDEKGHLIPTWGEKSESLYLHKEYDKKGSLLEEYIVKYPVGKTDIPCIAIGGVIYTIDHANL